MHPLVKKAYAFAKFKHEGQKYGKFPFIYHPHQVYEIIQLVYPSDVNLQCASLLHDCIEQTQTTKDEIQEAFNLDVAELVEQVTKSDYNTFPRLESQRAVVLKFADRFSNLVSMTDWSEARQREYINKSRFWLPKLPLDNTK